MDSANGGFFVYDFAVFLDLSESFLWGGEWSQFFQWYIFDGVAVVLGEKNRSRIVKDGRSYSG